MGSMCHGPVDAVAQFLSLETEPDRKIARDLLAKALRSSRVGETAGRALRDLSQENREELLLELIEILATEAKDWLKRQNLKLELDRGESVTTWINVLLQSTSQWSRGVIEQHLIGATLERRFPALSVSCHPAHAPNRQRAGGGDFAIGKAVCHVTRTPSRRIIEKCIANVKDNTLPLLLVPRGQEYMAKVMAEEAGIDEALAILTIEAFVAQTVMGLATDEEKDCFTVLTEIVEIYNRRLREVETDLSLQIEVC
jgi:hypothetical protein